MAIAGQSEQSELRPADFLTLLRDKISLTTIPFTERGSRIMIFANSNHESLYVKLAERWVKREQQFGNYRVRLPIISELSFTDDASSPLALQWVTYPDHVDLTTSQGTAVLTFQDPETVYLALPSGRTNLSMLVHAVADTARSNRRGGEVREGRGGRNIAYTTNAAILSNSITKEDSDHWRVRLSLEAAPGAALTINITPRLGFNRVLPPRDEVAKAAVARWNEWFAAAPRVPQVYWRQYYYAWWIMRAGLISPRYYMTHEGMTPSKIHYVGVWQWDAYFHAIAYRYVDAHLAEDQLRIFLDHQLPNGMIPDAVHDEGLVANLLMPVAAPVTKPPLVAWAALKLYEVSGNLAFLDEIYEPLARWNTWWQRENDSDNDGVVEYTHPFSSGLDDSPLWDLGMPVESPDINTYLYIQMESLAKIATLLGLHDEAAEWSKRARLTMRQLTRHLYDAQNGLFCALRDHRTIPVLTPFNLYPLWTGRVNRAASKRLISHLIDPAEFWTRYPIPTVAINDPMHDPSQMWRGPTWININYIFIEALLRTRHAALARELAQRTIDLVMGQEDIAEYYDPQTGAIPRKAAPMYGWSAALFIDLVVRQARGLL
jgi:putative isomerase